MQAAIWKHLPPLRNPLYPFPQFASFHSTPIHLAKWKSKWYYKDEREAALEELKTVELQHKKLKEELACYADNDPAALEAMKNAIEVAHSAANRWTDNIFTLQQWCSTNFPEAKEQLEHMYKEVGITDDFEYLQ